MPIINSATGLRDLFKELKGLKDGSRIVLDTETTGLDMFGYADRYTKPLGKPGGPDGELIQEEVDAFGHARICGIAVGIPFGSGIRTSYLPLRHETPEKQLKIGAISELVEIINLKQFRIVNHNTKFDLKMLYADGAMPDEKRVLIDDTMLLAHILDERVEKFSLEYLVEYYTDHKMGYKDWARTEFKKRKYRRYSQFSAEELGPYAEDDVRGTWKLFKALHPHLLDGEEPWFGDADLAAVYETEMKVLWVTTRMEINGMKIDVEKCRKLRDENNVALTGVLAEIEVVAPEVNPFSFKQLKGYFESKGWPVPVDPLRDSETFQDMSLFKMLPSGPNKEPLEHPDYPGLRNFVRLLVKARSLRKFVETYFDSYLRLADPNGFLHPSFNQHGTVTGRLSSSQPNFQNIPKTVATGRTAMQKASEEIIQSPVRGIIIPRSPDHRLVDIDYSQQEIRMFLQYVDEPKMRAVIAHKCEKKDCIDGDVHHLSASEMWKHKGGMPPKYNADGTPNDDYKRARHMAKFINFGIIYGMGRRKLAEMFELTASEADAYYRGYLDTYPHIKEFIEIVRGVADRRKYVKNIFGRRRRMRILTAEEKRTGRVKTGLGYTSSVRSEDQTADAHKALNAIIQGGSADLVKRSMLRIHTRLEQTDSFLVNQIHDSLVFEIHKDEMDTVLPEVLKDMTDWPQFEIPFTADIMIAKWDWSTSEASRV